ncbi:ferric uptake regulator, Fur family [Caldalkalibacillus thermarum TA2.A1]|uniref:Ferric uptake regulator, Fur family n=1 Tax=Caldalkalibacillus thermarum (strain TA2.A1) TaxID=986075 RepID=F5L375_CALTT|nr:Fur family transcriptional regulator [Caldalkalibacillus thermarum]EGL84207.1 ferric uptake regulator, Fur family [Caldalkalibacillus thermarum TA2.A1]QZT35077.1 transcriptional repressor [Caldalkalibacillus thermarum TA2.A1]
MSQKMDSSIVELLSSHNIRVTPQRVGIFNALKKLKHPTAEQIMDHLRPHYPNMSMATVYNTLRFFKQAGLVRDIHCGEDCTRFEVSKESHNHLICETCGSIEDMDLDLFINFGAIAERFGFKLDAVNIELYGQCPSCQEKEKK